MQPNSTIAPTTVLMLSANPKGTDPLRLDEERREIEAGLLERSRLRDQFQIITKTAVRPRDFQRAMLDHQPQILHFSGHGGGEQGLALENEVGKVKLVSAEALADLLELYADRLHCVVLNACYSEVQAEAIVQHIPYAIGMSDQIGDRAAIEFAVAFYDALGAGRDVEFAYKNACVAIKLAGIAQSYIPVLHQKTELNVPPLSAMSMSSLSHDLTDNQVSLLKWFADEILAGRLKDEIFLVFEEGNKTRILNYKGSNSPPEIFQTTLKILEKSSCIVYISTVLSRVEQVHGVCGDFKRKVKRQACKITLTRQAYEIVDASFGNSPTSSVHLPSSPTTQPEPMTSGKRQRLEEKQAALQSDWNKAMEKLRAFRQQLAIEAGMGQKFQLEKEVQAIEANLANLEAELDKIEQALEPPKK